VVPLKSPSLSYLHLALKFLCLVLNLGLGTKIIYIFRDVSEAAKFGIIRWKKAKRIVPVKVFANGHFESAKTFVEDTHDYALSKVVGVIYINNRNHEDPAQRTQEITFEEFQNLRYTDVESVRALVQEASDKEYESDRETYFDDRIPAALAGGQIEYRPGANPLVRRTESANEGDGPEGDRRNQPGTPGRPGAATSENPPTEAEVADDSRSRTAKKLKNAG
jgi:hypothetical protein